jgi:hypothetical protein
MCKFNFGLSIYCSILPPTHAGAYRSEKYLLQGANYSKNSAAIFCKNKS